MMFAFIIHYNLRKGLGPEWVPLTSEHAFDDLPEETTVEEAKQMAIDDFKETRRQNGTTEKEYYITDIVSI